MNIYFSNKQWTKYKNYPSAAFSPPLLIRLTPSKKKPKNPETIQLTIKTQINMCHNRNVIQYYTLIFPTQCGVLIFIAYSSY